MRDMYFLIAVTLRYITLSCVVRGSALFLNDLSFFQLFIQLRQDFCFAEVHLHSPAEILKQLEGLSQA